MLLLELRYITTPSYYMFRRPLSKPSSAWSTVYLRRWCIQLTILFMNARSCIIYQNYLKYYDYNNMHWNTIKCIKIIFSSISMIQYIVKIYSVKLRILDWCSGLECVIFYLCYGGNCCVAAVAYLARMRYIHYTFHLSWEPQPPGTLRTWTGL
jgi:hypothetical protein